MSLNTFPHAATSLPSEFATPTVNHHDAARDRRQERGLLLKHRSPRNAVTARLWVGVVTTDIDRHIAGGRLIAESRLYSRCADSPV